MTRCFVTSGQISCGSRQLVRLVVAFASVNVNVDEIDANERGVSLKDVTKRESLLAKHVSFPLSSRSLRTSFFPPASTYRLTHTLSLIRHYQYRMKLPLTVMTLASIWPITKNVSPMQQQATMSRTQLQPIKKDEPTPLYIIVTRLAWSNTSKQSRIVHKKGRKIGIPINQERQ